MNKEKILESPLENIIPMIENKKDYIKIFKIFRGKTVGMFFNRNIKKRKRVFFDQCNRLEADIRKIIDSAQNGSILLEQLLLKEIPYFDENENYTIKQKIELFLKQYVKRLQYVREGEKYAKIISLSYNLDGILKSNDEIANEFHLSRESIRQKKIQVMHILDSGTFNNIKINSDFLNEIRELKNKSLYCDVENFKNYIGEPNISNEEVKRIANIISLDITNTVNDKNTRRNYQFIVNDGEIVIFTYYFRKVVKLMREEILPLPVDFIVNKLDKSEKHIDFIRHILHNHNWIEEVICNNDTVCYQLKWQFLYSVTTKAKRIIFELKKPLHKFDILEEYNRREKNNPIKKEQLVIKQEKNDNFHAQRNGYWYYSDVRKKNVSNFIEEYIRNNNGKVFFDNVCQVMENEGYIYPVNTIRTYITSICFVAKSDLNILIHKDFKNIYPDIDTHASIKQNVGNTIINLAVDYLKQCPDNKSTQTDCVKYVYNTTILTIKKGNIGQYIQNLLVNANIVIKEGMPRNYNLTLNLEELKKCDLENLGKRRRKSEKRKYNKH